MQCIYREVVHVQICAANAVEANALNPARRNAMGISKASTVAIRQKIPPSNKTSRTVIVPRHS